MNICNCKVVNCSCNKTVLTWANIWISHLSPFKYKKYIPYCLAFRLLLPGWEWSKLRTKCTKQKLCTQFTAVTQSEASVDIYFFAIHGTPWLRGKTNGTLRLSGSWQAPVRDTVSTVAFGKKLFYPVMKNGRWWV